jgi:hypothetical protein
MTPLDRLASTSATPAVLIVGFGRLVVVGEDV